MRGSTVGSKEGVQTTPPLKNANLLNSHNRKEINRLGTSLIFFFNFDPHTFYFAPNYLTSNISVSWRKIKEGKIWIQKFMHYNSMPNVFCFRCQFWTILGENTHNCHRNTNTVHIWKTISLYWHIISFTMRNKTDFLQKFIIGKLTWHIIISLKFWTLLSENSHSCQFKCKIFVDFSI